MAMTIIPPELKSSAEATLNDVEEDLRYHTAQIRAIATAIQALLPEHAMSHPCLDVDNAELSTASGKAKIALRDNLIAARELTRTLDHSGCHLFDQLPERLKDARESLGLSPSPYMAELAAALKATRGAQ